MIPEQKLFRNVLINAALEAKRNTRKGGACDALQNYNWSKTRDCKLVCDYAGIDWGCVKGAFEKIYKETNPTKESNVVKFSPWRAKER